ncbi:ABC transporter permease [Vagococcus lutrae]|uniref:ABC transporter permease n=1 Tax=Vagococcus lutrae TaxID=81947 RepID=A0AAF0BIL3_9ENTE|nr:ABC transporter permease [Vagococcus lutrae]MCO7150438.1 ABC transporter permease [Vagococcus lutrae]MDT2802273.1 ABC transporter permease [Vagococcus lutrae]MDT2811704.1 ABC transporter permease [Vagococcus lutrae]MDT2818838.1 ABC transporter permease [Vagococcus lutrae]MDT2843595.1 ABC transporter permease [Vagococcus lutrae]
MGNQHSKWKNLAVPVISVLAGLLLGAIIMLVSGYNPVEGYGAMLKGAFGRTYNIGEVLRLATPLILTGLGFSVANTAGFFNIGLAGQALCGWIGAIWVAMTFPDLPRIVLVPLAIIVGALAGAIWAGIAGYLRAQFGTSEVIVTIMLNYTILYISNHLVRNVFTDSADATPKIGENASLRMQFLSDMSGGSRLNGGIFLAVLMIILVWILMKRTTTGFELRAVGMNPFASEYAGMSAKRNIVLAMVISGALAGMGGVVEGLGTFENLYILDAAPQIGFDGMAVSLLGGGNPIGILLSAILFGILKIGGLKMPSVGIPNEIVDIVVASIIFFVGISFAIRFIMDKLSVKKGEA